MYQKFENYNFSANKVEERRERLLGYEYLFKVDNIQLIDCPLKIPYSENSAITKNYKDEKIKIHTKI